MREVLRIGDIIESMLTGLITVIRTNDAQLARQIRRMDDDVDDLYTAIKLYLTQIGREALDERDARRWADIISFTINMEHVGDIIERMLDDLVDKKIAQRLEFSDAGMLEICDMHARVVANLRLGMNVFLNGDLKSAQRLLATKVELRKLAAAVRRHAPAAPRRADGTIDRDQLAAPRHHQRLQAHQLAHLLGRLRDPRAGRAAAADAPARGIRRRRRCQAKARMIEEHHRPVRGQGRQGI